MVSFGGEVLYLGRIRSTVPNSVDISGEETMWDKYWSSIQFTYNRYFFDLLELHTEYQHFLRRREISTNSLRFLEDLQLMLDEKKIYRSYTSRYISHSFKASPWQVKPVRLVAFFPFVNRAGSYRSRLSNAEGPEKIHSETR
ncbi:uncharacterized protein LOC114875024 isoform X2 [Osmia bicornis bicornis]|uniref:uncharacterized protein LOC114875024 isoform X2 n=1 Tax=Osmia bicornis bicornis TaxID=1437191 RepID=UPI0010F58A89|nr:uncharacterized protein LOC114875024 isoform X2 [Osmia bicornis bicornis]